MERERESFPYRGVSCAECACEFSYNEGVYCAPGKFKHCRVLKLIVSILLRVSLAFHFIS